MMACGWWLGFSGCLVLLSMLSFGGLVLVMHGGFVLVMPVACGGVNGSGSWAAGGEKRKQAEEIRPEAIFGNFN